VRTVLLFLLLLGPAVCLAQPEAPPFTVDDAVRLAVTNNPRLSAAQGNVTAAEAGVRSARAWANPSLTFTPAVTSGGSDEEVLLQQPLELNGTRSARTNVATAQRRQVGAEATVALRQVVFQTKSAYYDLARARELETVARELLATAEEVDRNTRRQVEVGSRPGIDLTQTGIEVNRARQQLTLATSQVSAALAALNTLMGRAPRDPVGALSPLSVAASTLESDVALRQALEARAEITAAEATRDVFRGEAALARAEGRPDLVPQLRAGSVTRGVEDTGVGLGITLPLFDYGGRRARIQQAEAAARAQEDRIRATRSEVSQEVEQALVRLRASEAIIRDYQQGVLDQARQLLEASRRGFQAGATSILSFLEAQRTYRSVLTEYTNALAAHAQAVAELERAVGAVSPALLRAARPGDDVPTRSEQ
jgi:cobalt-zinc-cadmium efflux system outer membrane protein